MTMLDNDRAPRQLGTGLGCLLAIVLSLPLWAMLIAAAYVCAQILKQLIEGGAL